MESYIYDGYLEHYGIKGQKWGVQRTPEQLGRAVSKGRQSISSFFENANRSVTNAKKAHQDKVAAKNKAQLAKYESKAKAQQEKIDLVNQKLAVKQQKAELKRLKKSLRTPDISTGGTVDASKPYFATRRQQRQEKKQLDRLARQQATRNARSQLLQNAIVSAANGGVKVAATSLTNDPNASDGVRLFAKYMGGEEKPPAKNSLDLIKTKSFSEMSDTELKEVNVRLQTMDHIDTILDAQRKKHSPNDNSYQNGNDSYSLMRRR